MLPAMRQQATTAAWYGSCNIHRRHPYLWKSDWNEVVMTSLAALRRLYRLHAFSMPSYVLAASPFVAPGDEPILDVLRNVTAQQEQQAMQLAEAILLSGGSPPKGAYPTNYSSLHDLEVRYLLSSILSEQRLMVGLIEELVHSLRHDRLAHRIAQGVRRNATAHLHLFEELCLRYPVTGRHRRDGHASDHGISRIPQASRKHATPARAARQRQLAMALAS